MEQKEKVKIAKRWLIIMFAIVLAIGVLSAYLQYIGKNSPALTVAFLILGIFVLYVVVKVIIPRAVNPKK